MAQNIIANQLEVFDKDIQSCRAIQAQLTSTFEKTFEEINALTAMWSGSAHDAFLQQFQNDSENMKQLLDFIDKYLVGLEDAKKKYQQCESQVDEAIRSINV